MIELFPSRTEVLVIGDFVVRWYGLLYVLAFWLAWFLLPKLQTYRNIQLSRDQWTYIVALLAGGLLVGGRLGYMLFYEPTYFITHPLGILFLWEGGMSSHGGFLGVLATSYGVARWYKLNWFAFLDILTVPAGIGLALGRLGNFINQELYGVATSLPWGIEVPGVEGKRHPTQMYAVIKNGGVAVISFLLLRKTHQLKPGQVTAVAIMVYCIFRFIIELYREQPWAYTAGLTRGQLLTIPLFLVGIWLWKAAIRRSA